MRRRTGWQPRGRIMPAPQPRLPSRRAASHHFDHCQWRFARRTNETFCQLVEPRQRTMSTVRCVGTINNDDPRRLCRRLCPNANHRKRSSSPTAIAIHPDGRIFVCQQSGQLRVIKTGRLLARHLQHCRSTQRRAPVCGITFDPTMQQIVLFTFLHCDNSDDLIASSFHRDVANEDSPSVGASSNPRFGKPRPSNHNAGASLLAQTESCTLLSARTSNSSNTLSRFQTVGKNTANQSDEPCLSDNPTTF